MKLTGPQGEFELTILDYEYSDSTRFMERNWLLVSLKTRVNGRECQQAAPLLSTWELELLRDWMRSFADGQPPSPRLTFIEPDLTFRTDAAGRGDYRFQIKLSQQAAPDWQTDRTKPCWLTVAADKQQLQTAIHDLDYQLSRFPVRK